MKPVYNITLCDPVYSHYSDEVLTNIAIDFLRMFQGANFRSLDADISSKRRLFTSDALQQRSCVEAKPGEVKIDFSWAAIQGWVHSEIFNAESVIDEILKRMKEKGIAFNEDVNVAFALAEEIVFYVDKFCIPPALSAEDVIYSAQQISNELNLR